MCTRAGVQQQGLGSHYRLAAYDPLIITSCPAAGGWGAKGAGRLGGTGRLGGRGAPGGGMCGKKKPGNSEASILMGCWCWGEEEGLILYSSDIPIHTLARAEENNSAIEQQGDN